MRLRHRTLTIVALPFLLCGGSCGGRPIALQEPVSIYPTADAKTPAKAAAAAQAAPAVTWTGADAPPAQAQAGQQKGFFVAHVDKEGIVRVKGTVVTEEQLAAEAEAFLDATKDAVAVLFVETGVMDGIRLSALLAGAGYKNVQVFYPTATNR